MKFIIISSIVSVIYIFIACFTFLGIISYPIFILLILIPIILCIVFKLIIECRMYGKENVFRFSQKGKSEVDRREIFLKSLQEQLNSHVFVSSINSKMIIILNENGAYLYSFLQEKGMYFECGNKWYLKSGRQEIEVISPIEELNTEKEKVEENLKIEISACIVLDTSTFLKKGNKKYPILNIINAPFYICKTDLLKRLDEDQIKLLMKRIENNLFYQNVKEVK